MVDSLGLGGSMNAETGQAYKWRNDFRNWRENRRNDDSDDSGSTDANAAEGNSSGDTNTSSGDTNTSSGNDSGTGDTNTSSGDTNTSSGNDSGTGSNSGSGNDSGTGSNTSSGNDSGTGSGNTGSTGSAEGQSRASESSAYEGMTTSGGDVVSDKSFREANARTFTPSGERYVNDYSRANGQETPASESIDFVVDRNNMPKDYAYEGYGYGNERNHDLDEASKRAYNESSFMDGSEGSTEFRARYDRAMDAKSPTDGDHFSLDGTDKGHQQAYRDAAEAARQAVNESRARTPEDVSKIISDVSKVSMSPEAMDTMWSDKSGVSSDTIGAKYAGDGAYVLGGLTGNTEFDMSVIEREMDVNRHCKFIGVEGSAARDGSAMPYTFSQTNAALNDAVSQILAMREGIFAATDGKESNVVKYLSDATVPLTDALEYYASDSGIQQVAQAMDDTTQAVNMAVMAINTEGPGFVNEYDIAAPIIGKLEKAGIGDEMPIPPIAANPAAEGVVRSAIEAGVSGGDKMSTVLTDAGDVATNVVGALNGSEAFKADVSDVADVKTETSSGADQGAPTVPGNAPVAGAPAASPSPGGGGGPVASPGARPSSGGGGGGGASPSPSPGSNRPGSGEKSGKTDEERKSAAEKIADLLMGEEDKDKDGKDKDKDDSKLSEKEREEKARERLDEMLEDAGYVVDGGGASQSGINSVDGLPLQGQPSVDENGQPIDALTGGVDENGQPIDSLTGGIDSADGSESGDEDDLDRRLSDATRLTSGSANAAGLRDQLAGTGSGLGAGAAREAGAAGGAGAPVAGGPTSTAGTSTTPSSTTGSTTTPLRPGQPGYQAQVERDREQAEAERRAEVESMTSEAAEKMRAEGEKSAAEVAELLGEGGPDTGLGGSSVSLPEGGWQNYGEYLPDPFSAEKGDIVASPHGDGVYDGEGNVDMPDGRRMPINQLLTMKPPEYGIFRPENEPEPIGDNADDTQSPTQRGGGFGSATGADPYNGGQPPVSAPETPEAPGGAGGQGAPDLSAQSSSSGLAGGAGGGSADPFSSSSSEAPQQSAPQPSYADVPSSNAEEGHADSEVQRNNTGTGFAPTYDPSISSTESAPAPAEEQPVEAPREHDVNSKFEPIPADEGGRPTTTGMDAVPASVQESSPMEETPEREFVAADDRTKDAVPSEETQEGPEPEESEHQPAAQQDNSGIREVSYEGRALG